MHGKTASDEEWRGKGLCSGDKKTQSRTKCCWKDEGEKKRSEKKRNRERGPVGRDHGKWCIRLGGGGNKSYTMRLHKNEEE